MINSKDQIHCAIALRCICHSSQALGMGDRAGIVRAITEPERAAHDIFRARHPRDCIGPAWGGRVKTSRQSLSWTGGPPTRGFFSREGRFWGAGTAFRPAYRGMPPNIRVASKGWAWPVRRATLGSEKFGELFSAAHARSSSGQPDATVRAFRSCGSGKDQLPPPTLASGTPLHCASPRSRSPSFGFGDENSSRNSGWGGVNMMAASDGKSGGGHERG